MTLADSRTAIAAGADPCENGVTLIRGAQLVASPWKNGGGVTREVAAHPAHAGLDTFIWRVSVADVAEAGPFSRFAGIDRTLVLLKGAGMLLDEAQSGATATTHALTQPLDAARFAGEACIDARLVDGPTRDFNLMVRRDCAQGELEVWCTTPQSRIERMLSADVALLYCASGELAVTCGGAPADTQADTQADAQAQKQQLQAGDTLRIDAPNALRCTIEGAGALLAIRIRYTQR